MGFRAQAPRAWWASGLGWQRPPLPALARGRPGHRRHTACSGRWPRWPCLDLVGNAEPTRGRFLWYKGIKNWEEIDVKHPAQSRYKLFMIVRSLFAHILI